MAFKVGGTLGQLGMGAKKLVDNIDGTTANNNAADDRKKVDAAQQQALAGFQGLEAPTIATAGSPANGFDMGYYTTADSGMNNVKVDPALRQAQMNALQNLENIGNSNGLTDADRALIASTDRDAAMQDKSRRDAILQNNAARGMAGSGNELLAQLASSQAATDRSNQNGLTVAGQAQQRALAALEQAGTLGGQMEGQDWQEQADKAKAQDQINQFNANVKNNSVQNNNQWKQQVFQNQSGIAANKANVLNGLAATQENRANQQAATAANNQNTLLNMATGGLTGYLKSQQDKDKDKSGGGGMTSALLGAFGG